MSLKTDGSAAIVSRMRELRSTGLKDVNQLHAQVERVTDWREHVRAHPGVTLAAASLLGFALVRKLTNVEPAGQQIFHSQPGSIVNQKSATRGLLSLAGGMAVSLGRQWLTEYIKKHVGVHAHAANQPTDAGQRSHSIH